MLHPSTFDDLAPSDAEAARMATCRAAAKAYADVLDQALLEGADKDFVLRELRTLAMWVNVCIARAPDGTPRQ